MRVHISRNHFWINESILTFEKTTLLKSRTLRSLIPLVVMTMKYVIILSAFLFCLSCSEEKGEDIFVPASFQVDSTIISLNYTPRDIIQYKDGYLCRVRRYHEDSMDLIYLNNQFEIQYDFSRTLNESLGKGVNAIWTSNDTLFAIQGYRYYEVSYWANNNWQVVDSGSMTKENYMHQEQNYPIFEDENYVVSSCCKGEFGGAVYFKDKSSQRIFSCEATCIAGVHKIGGSYFVTSSLAHGSGFAKLIEIRDPKKLYEIKDQKQLLDCSWYDIYPDDPRDQISHPVGYTSSRGLEILLDTMGVFILGSFNFENHLYHIYSDMNNAYIGYQNNGVLIPIDTIYNKPMWLSEVRDLEHNANIFPIRSREMKGIILIEGNKLKIVEFTNE